MSANARYSTVSALRRYAILLVYGSNKNVNWDVLHWLKGALIRMVNRITIVAYAIAIAAVIAFGVAGTYILGRSGNFNVQINSLVTALYFTVTTVSTVGYGDIVPVTEAARIFVVVLILSGLSIFLSAVTVLSSDFVNSRIERLSGRISGIEKRLLKGHIVLIGHDLTNALLAERFKAENRKFIIITADKTISDHLRELGYVSYVADATSESDMKNFKLDIARKIIIDLRDSSRTVYAAIVARSLSGSGNMIVIAPTLELERHLNDIGIKNVINPATMAAKQISGSLGRLR